MLVLKAKNSRVVTHLELYILGTLQALCRGDWLFYCLQKHYRHLDSPAAKSLVSQATAL